MKPKPLFILLLCWNGEKKAAQLVIFFCLLSSAITYYVQYEMKMFIFWLIVCCYTLILHVFFFFFKFCIAYYFEPQNFFCWGQLTAQGLEGLIKRPIVYTLCRLVYSLLFFFFSFFKYLESDSLYLCWLSEWIFKISFLFLLMSMESDFMVLSRWLAKFYGLPILCVSF